jgi:hypothetical protein
MASMTHQQRQISIRDLKNAIAAESSALSATSVLSSLDALSTMASTASNMDTATAIAIVETLAVSSNSIDASLKDESAAFKKQKMIDMVANTDAAMLAVTANVLGGMNPGDAPQEFSSGSDMKLSVKKASTASLASTTETIVSASGQSISFQMPVTLPARISGLSNVGIQMAARTNPYSDPDDKVPMATEAVSLAFTDDQGNELKDLVFTEPIQFSLSLSNGLADPACYFWNVTEGDYSTEGVNVVSATSNLLTCETYHLTEFSGGEKETAAPTKSPTQSPTKAPTLPTHAPTPSPSASPTLAPTQAPTIEPHYEYQSAHACGLAITQEYLTFDRYPQYVTQTNKLDELGRATGDRLKLSCCQQTKYTLTLTGRLEPGKEIFMFC